MSDEPERWDEVGVMVRDRMAALAISQAELVERSGVSDFTIRKLMRGVPGNYRPDRLTKVELALDWPRDSVTDVLNGEPPGASEKRRLQVALDTCVRELEVIERQWDEAQEAGDEAYMQRLRQQIDALTTRIDHTTMLDATVDDQVAGRPYRSQTNPGAAPWIAFQDVDPANVPDHIRDAVIALLTPYKGQNRQP